MDTLSEYPERRQTLTGGGSRAPDGWSQGLAKGSKAIVRPEYAKFFPHPRVGFGLAQSRAKPVETHNVAGLSLNPGWQGKCHILASCGQSAIFIHLTIWVDTSYAVRKSRTIFVGRDTRFASWRSSSQFSHTREQECSSCNAKMRL